MPMSPEALEHDAQSSSPKISIKKIFIDNEFNCRGHVTASGDIVELAADIAAKGLMSPVIIRPIWSTETDRIAKGFEYSLIAGFRRITAYRINGAEVIPCTIENVKNDFEARDINARENLQRKDLTLWQECVTIRHYWAADWNRLEIALRIGKSQGWVQVRCMLLEMQPEIQQFANDGYINQQDVRTLHRYGGLERLKIANKIRDLRKTGKPAAVIRAIKKPDKASSRKVRTAFDVQQMMDRIRTYSARIDRSKSIEVSKLVTEQGNMITHRVMAWATGSVTVLDLHMSLREFFNYFGVKYDIPDFAEERL